MQWSRAALCQTPDMSVSIPMSCTNPTLQIGRLRLRSQVMIQPALVPCWPLRPLPKALGTRMVAMGQGEVERGSAFSVKHRLQPGSTTSLVCGLRGSLTSLNITFFVYRMVVKISDHG